MGRNHFAKKEVWYGTTKDNIEMDDFNFLCPPFQETYKHQLEELFFYPYQINPYWSLEELAKHCAILRLQNKEEFLKTYDCHVC